MTIPVKLKRSGTTTATPSSLEYGEIAINYADGVVFYRDAADTIQSFTLQSYALASHTHAASDITSGTIDAARLPLATTGAAGAVIVGTGLGVSSGTVSVTYGTTAGTSCQGDDSRLSDARTPTSHSHGNITNAGAIGSTANLPIITTTSGVLTTGSFGTTATTFCEGNDSRLSDTRTPTDGSVTTAKIVDSAVTYAKLQNVSATDRILGRSSSGAGPVEEVTCTAFGRSLIDDADAAAARTTLGVQPTASPTFTGTVHATTFAGSGSFNPNENGGWTNAALRASGSFGGGVAIVDGSAGFSLYAVSSGGEVRLAHASVTGTPITLVSISSAGVSTFSGQLLVTAGNASSPGVAFSGDTNTGMWSPGADQLAFSTNQTERMRINASGNVGIGKAPNARLHVNSGTNQNFYVRAGIRLSGSALQSIQDDNASDSPLEIYTQSQVQIEGNPITFYNNGEVVRVTSGGAVLIGTTTDNGAYKLQVNSQIYATNATIATSDARFKTNVESLADATAVIEALRPVAFDFIPHEERNFAAERQVGLIAQEAQAALAGTDYADSVVAQCGDHLGLAYEKLVPVLIKALQESNARIAALEERLNHA